MTSSMAGVGEASPVFDIPKECKGAVVVNEGPDFHVEIQMLPVPEPGPEDVLIRLNVTGVCHTDSHFMIGDLGVPKMSEFGTRCAGHEGAGIIVKVGERVSSLKPGTRVGFKPMAGACGVCESCRDGQDQYCKERIFVGLQTEGSFKTFVVSPAKYTVTIPDGVSDYVAAPAMCAAATILTSLKASHLRPGDWAVFIGGGGGVGIQGVQLASAMSMKPIVVDTGESKKKLALSVGAEAFIDFKENEDAAAEVVKITSGGAHGVFVCASEAYPGCMAYLGERVGAKLMCIAVPSAGENKIAVEPGIMCIYNWSIIGTLNSSTADLQRTLDFAKRGKLHLEPEVVGLSQLSDAIQRLQRGEVAGRIVVDFNKE